MEEISTMNGLSGNNMNDSNSYFYPRLWKCRLHVLSSEKHSIMALIIKTNCTDLSTHCSNKVIPVNS